MKKRRELPLAAEHWGRDWSFQLDLLASTQGPSVFLKPRSQARTKGLFPVAFRQAKKSDSTNIEYSPCARQNMLDAFIYIICSICGQR